MSTLDELLAAPTAKPVTRVKPEAELTRSIAVTKTTVEAEIRDREGLVNEGTGLKYLEEEGLNPDDWEATHFRKIKYGQDMESVKFSYKRVGNLDPDRPDISELIAVVRKARPSKSEKLTGEHAFVLAMGDHPFFFDRRSHLGHCGH